jgi:AcrR family transcriptional regulator
MLREFTAPSIEDTKLRILHFAQVLFAEKGVENVSLRELTTTAGTNLGAVNYHFGTKDVLVEAVFDQLSARVNTQRLLELSEILATAKQKRHRPSPRDILVTFLRPYLQSDSGEGALLAQLVLKHRVASSDITKRIIARHFDPMARQYVDAYVLACPGVPPQEFYWRYMFVAGSVIMTATDRNRANRVSSISQGTIDGSDTEALIDALLRFLIGGISAK